MRSEIRGSMREVAANVWAVSATVVNWVIVREGSDVTLVDSGWPGDFEVLVATMGSLGLRTNDIAAVLLTHSHVDHTGGLNRLWERHRTPVLMHPQEVPLAARERVEQATALDVIRRSWRPKTAWWGIKALRVGGMSDPPTPHAQAWPSEWPLDLPGNPVPVPCAGHTSGHTAYSFPDLGVMATGDALVTAHPTSGKSRPHLLPTVFNASVEQAREALERLGAADADIVVPGHGPPWLGPIERAAEIAIQDHDASQSTNRLSRMALRQR